jgi:hypothetical protein
VSFLSTQAAGIRPTRIDERRVPSMSCGALIQPWTDPHVEHAPELPLFDATHVASDDPSGLSAMRRHVLKSLEVVGARVAEFGSRSPTVTDNLT